MENMTKLYAQVTGIVFLLVGIIGFVMPTIVPGFLHVSTTHSIVHVVLGLIGLYVGFMNTETKMMTMYAQVFGVVYVLLAVIGFASPTILENLGVFTAGQPALGGNVVHVLIGVWGLWTGFAAPKTAAA
jgi:hypothetical protein